ncbi:MAG: glycosyltransferase family 39 protein [bacterium]|nr:glycosyltransferase family 39 protein [bacterium]
MLKKIKKIPKIYWLLLMVFLIGSIGIFYNYGLYGPDEKHAVHSVLKFFRDFSLADKYSSFFPPVILLEIPFAVLMFLAYLLLGIGGISQLKELVIVDNYIFFPFFRLIIIIVAAATVFIFYKVCLKVFKKERPSLIAAFLLATSLLFAQRAHIDTTWMIQTMVLMAAIYYFLTLLEKEEWGIGVFLISALFIFLSVQIEPVGLIAIVPFFLIFWLKRKKAKIGQEGLKLCLFFLVIAALLVVSFYSNPVTFKTYFSVADTALRPVALSLDFSRSFYGQGLAHRILAFWETLFYLEPLLFALFIGGIIVAYKRDKFLLKIFGSYIAVYYFTLGPLMGGMSEKRLMPVIPAFAVFAALFIEFLMEKYQRKSFRKFVYAGLLVFIANPLIFDYALLKSSSPIEARNWIIKNIPADSSVFDTCWLELNENKNVINLIKERYPEFSTTKQRYLLERPYLLDLRKNYFVVSDYHLANQMDKNKFKYLVVCFYDDTQKQEILASFQEILAFFKDREKIKIYDSLAGRQKFPALNMFELTRFFKDEEKFSLKRLFNLPYNGPHIEIYQFLN